MRMLGLYRHRLKCHGVTAQWVHLLRGKVLGLGAMRARWQVTARTSTDRKDVECPLMGKELDLVHEVKWFSWAYTNMYVSGSRTKLLEGGWMLYWCCLGKRSLVDVGILIIIF